MLRRRIYKSHVLALVIMGWFSTGPALAEKPSWAGNDKGDKHERKSHKNNERDHEDQSSYDRGGDRHIYFGDQQRIVVRDYYTQQFHSGHCPPGLAKKHNGCRPPSHVRNWRVGRPLPHDVIYYDLPPAVVVQLGVPLPRHRYVRVATDILMIAVGTGMVVDAIEDLDGR